MPENTEDQERNENQKKGEFGRGGMSEEEKQRARKKGGERSHSGGRQQGS